MEDRRYAVLPRDTIRMFGESVGFSELPDDLVSMLSEDVTYRLRELIQNSCQFLRHARRKKLGVDDVNKALKNSDTPVILGYGTPEVLPFRQTREGDIYCIEDLDINLPNIACNSQSVPAKSHALLKADWLAVEGIQKTQILPAGLQAKLTSRGSVGITDDLVKYYDNVTSAILGNDEEIMKLALVDLRTNTKIAPLMPYFTNFFSNGVRTVNYDVSQLTKLLHTVRALVSNTSLSLQPKPFLELIVEGILVCLIEPLAASISPINDHWRLRDYAARLLAMVTGQWTTPLNQLRSANIRVVQDVFYDLTKPLCSHYGAIMGLLAFGTQAVEDVMLPFLPQMWRHLATCMDDNSYANIPAKFDAQMVHGALLLSADYVLRARVYQTLTCPVDEPEVSPPTPDLVPAASLPGPDSRPELKMEVSESIEPATEAPDLLGPVLNLPEPEDSHGGLASLYQEIYSYFGDRIAARMPVHHVEDDVYVARRKQLQVSLGDDEQSRKSGEELLKQFGDNLLPGVGGSGAMADMDEIQSNQTDMDYELEEKSERSSRSSRSHSDENLSYLADDSHLTLKATVSDPSRGIKLTILKRPKLKLPSMEEEVDYEEDEVMKLEEDVPMPILDAKPAPLPMRVCKPVDIRSVFEQEPMIQNNVLFVFSFLGSHHLYNAKRNSKRLHQYQQSTESSNLLRKHLKTHGKRKTVAKKKWLPLHFYSGNIDNTL